MGGTVLSGLRVLENRVAHGRTAGCKTRVSVGQGSATNSPALTGQSSTEDPILILGAPRSGTTWLAKIFDSHPDVLYRHEPDEVFPAPEDLDEHGTRLLVDKWIADRSLRTTTKRPFFRKSWQTGSAHAWHTALAYSLNGVARLPGSRAVLRHAWLPCFPELHRARVVIKSVRWCRGAGLFARSLPHSRTVLIVRRPCGQVASLMHGAARRRFELRDAGDMPFNEHQAIACAAAYGVTPARFHALPEAAKYAWSWVAFNETAVQALRGCPNTRVILHDILCAQPEAQAQALLGFAGLSWHPQTADFVARSTRHTGPSDYYAVFRDARAAAGNWRENLSAKDQRAVRDVVRQSSLAHFWPDILSGGGG